MGKPGAAPSSPPPPPPEREEGEGEQFSPLRYPPPSQSGNACCISRGCPRPFEKKEEEEENKKRLNLPPLVCSKYCSLLFGPL